MDYSIGSCVLNLSTKFPNTPNHAIKSAETGTIELNSLIVATASKIILNHTV